VPPLINVADRVPVTEAEGPGRRFALWVQGCPLRCPGCCNPHFLEFTDADWVEVEDLAAEILSHREEIEGVTFIGGEPFSQAAGLAALARRVQQAGLSVMIFTGHLLEELQARGPAHEALLAETDLLVDGPYLREKHLDDRRWIGSANQSVHYLTDRYRQLDENPSGWDEGRNTIELRLVNGQVTINGFPEASITNLARKRKAEDS